MANTHHSYPTCDVCGERHAAGHVTDCNELLAAAVADLRSELAEANAEIERLRGIVDKVVGQLNPDDLAAWIGRYGSCEDCGLDLIGFADRPVSVQCHGCHEAARAKGGG